MRKIHLDAKLQKNLKTLAFDSKDNKSYEHKLRTLVLKKEKSTQKESESYEENGL